MNALCALRWKFLSGVFFLGICVLLNVFFFPAALRFPDEGRFVEEARILVATGEFRTGEARAWEMPLSAILYSAVLKIFTDEAQFIPAIRMLQSLLLLGAAAAISRLTWRLFGDRLASLVAWTVMLFYPFFLFYQSLLLSETLFLALLSAAFCFLYEWIETQKTLTLCVAAALCALATYAKATLSIFPPVLFAVSLLAFPVPVDLRRGMRYILVGTCVYAACLSPWWIRNAVLFSRFIPFTTSASWNLYLGNNPSNTRGGVDWSVDVDSVKVAEIHRAGDELAVSDAFSREAKAFMKENPKTVFRLSLIKFVRFWNVFFNAKEFSSPFYNLVSLGSYGVVLLFALIATFVNRRKWRRFSPIFVLIAIFTVLHMIIIASLRYRLPLEPFLIALAAGPLSGLLRRMIPFFDASERRSI